MAITTSPDYPRGITFEEVWASMKELREFQMETARQLEKTDRLLKKTGREIKETGREIKETSRQMGYLNNRFGELAEHLVAPGIERRFNERGYHFGAVSPGGHKIVEDGKVKAEIDLLLENDETAMAVEIKVKPAVKDVEQHVKRLEVLRDYRLKTNKIPNKIQGAIAGAIFGTVEKKAAIEAGLFVLEQSGDTMKLDVPDGFVPRTW